MPTNLKGIGAKLYYKSAGTFASPTHTVVPLVRDLTVNRAHNSAPVVTRSTTIIREAPTTTALTHSGSMLADVDDTIYLAFRTAFLARSVIDVMILTGLSTNNGEEGWRYEALVKEMTQDQGADNVMYENFVLVPHAESVEVIQTVLVSAGAPVFTTYTGA